MRLYALLFALLVLRARAASIPEPAESEKKIQIPEIENVSEKTENTSSEQELIDQTNTIKDVENNLRVKPTEDIPVAVIVVNPEPILKISEETDDIVRSEPDLNNPGAPQRQLHETQNPEYHDAEQQSVLRFKQNFNDAQVILRQGFQGVSDGIHHIYENSEQLKTVQQTIKSLRDDFTSQISKLNDTIHHFLDPENPNNEKPADEESKAGFRRIETGLSSLKNDFNRGVKTLAEGVDVVASLKADSEGENADSSSSTVPPSSTTTLLLEYYLQLLHNAITTGFSNLTQTILTQAQGQGNPASTTVVSSNTVQADTPVTSTTQPPNPFLTGFQTGFQNIQNNWNGFVNNSQQALSNITNPFIQLFNQSNTNVNDPAPAGGALGSGNGPFGLIENNPIVSGFNNWVGTLFQQNRPQSPAAATVAPANDPVNEVVAVAPVAPAKQLSDVEKQKDASVVVIEAIKEEVKEVEGENKGHGPNRPGSGSGDKSDVGGVEKTSAAVEETHKDTVPEAPKEEVVDIEEKKAEQTDNKTE